MALHTIQKGLDLPITGAPVQTIQDARPVTRVAVMADDFIGMKPRMKVRVGDVVKRGQVLFEDRKCEGVVHVSPAGGTVAAIHRGARRALISVVIELGPEEQNQPFAAYKGADAAGYDADAARALLVETGLWTTLRSRPYGRTPALNGTPNSVFINAMDTNPLCADVQVASAGRDADFTAGLALLLKLVDCKVFLAKHEGSTLGGLAFDPRVSVETFRGPHPAGLVGTHIHTLDPVWRQKSVWHLNYADVIAWGALLRTGVLPVERVVALGGPGVKNPRLLRTRQGASLDQLLHGELHDGELRVVRGSILSGTRAAGEEYGYLGRYDLQVSALLEGREREFLGWLSPGFNVFSTMPTYVSVMMGLKKLLPISTSTNGSHRAMVPVGRYEEIMPLDIEPTFLLRAILAGDLETAETLGVLELEPEDVALCTVVDIGKHDFGPVLRKTLNTLEAEG
jgi:Na+-transporting NADH:ubiquinone oxidoreductase subunit A